MLSFCGRCLEADLIIGVMATVWVLFWFCWASFAHHALHVGDVGLVGLLLGVMKFVFVLLAVLLFCG